MDFNAYYEAIKHKIGRENMILHFRISTSSEINQLQTHPYKAGNVEKTRGITTSPIIAMNGSITGLIEQNNYNDTMTYINDHTEAFKAINNDILNIIGDATGCKWSVMLPNKVYLTTDFKEYQGRYYSNLNHINPVWSYADYYSENWRAEDYLDWSVIQYLTTEELFNADSYIYENCINSTKCNCKYCIMQEKDPHKVKKQLQNKKLLK